MTINQRTIHHAPKCVNNFLKGKSGIACSSKEVQPVPAEKCREVWSDLFQAHRGKVPRLPWCMRPPRLCRCLKNAKSENLAPYAPQISGFNLLSLFSSGAYLLFPGGCRARDEPKRAPRGRIQSSHAPCKTNIERYFCVVWGAWGA